MSESTIELHAGEMRLALRPDLGGCVAGLWLGELPVLWSFAPDTLHSARPSACYPLVPYSNRIGHRHFTWQGEEFHLAANVDEPHTLHGVGWQRPWAVDCAEATHAELRYVHQADAHWPFDFEARQLFVLSPQGLEMRIVLTNTDARLQPLGYGWHPYFPKRERSHLQAPVRGRWEADPTLLPAQLVGESGIDAAVADLDLDNVFEGWRREAVIADELLSVRITSGERWLVVYARPSKDHFCVEPVSHRNNAIQTTDPGAHGLQAVEPGESIEGWMRLDVTRP